MANADSSAYGGRSNKYTSDKPRRPGPTPQVTHNTGRKPPGNKTPSPKGFGY